MRNEVPEENRFMSVFPNLQLKDKYLEFFKDVKIKRINAYRKSKKIQIQIEADYLIPSFLLGNVEDRIAEHLGLNSIEIKPKFNITDSIEEILEDYWESIVFIINSKVALSRGILNESSHSIVGKKLVVRLRTTGADILKAQSCDLIIEEFIEYAFSFSLKVEFEDFQYNEESSKEYIEFKEQEEQKVISQEEAAQKIIASGAGGKAKKKRDAKSNDSNIILGKNFNDSFMNISDITQESGKVAISGDVFGVENREIRGNRYICKFDITDYSNSHTVKFFIKKDDFDFVSENIKNGIRVKVRGETQYDKYSRELVIMASDIIQIIKEEKCDDAEEKRVELHLHTQMSSLDAITPVKELVKRAAKWGHKAIAITDHGVVQAYPDAYETAKKNNIKVIYGLECYIQDDEVPVVYHSNGYSLDNELTVFDIETTGLYAEKDKITEIGAVKIKDGEIIDQYSTLINPEIPIPSFITKLTGITDGMVKDAPTIEVALNDFLNFIQDTPVIAHNANFDTGFIRYNARKIGREFTNPIIDTLQLSRNMLPRLKKHKLDSIAKHFDINMGDHHRAVDDSKTTAQIFIKCIDILKKREDVGKVINIKTGKDKDKNIDKDTDKEIDIDIDKNIDKDIDINKGSDKDESTIRTIDDLQNAFKGNSDFTKAETYHAIILVKNHVGLKNLYKIVSESHLKYFYKKPRVPKSLLMTYREGLILGSACEAGELFTAILNRKSDDEIRNIAYFYDYFEIQPLGNNQFLINKGKVNSTDDLIEINRKIINLGEKYKKPVVGTCDVHFMDAGDEVFRRILMGGQGYTDADNQAPLYFRTTNEMLNEFSYLDNEKAYEIVVTNTNKISDMIEEIAPVPEGTFPPKMEGAEEEIKRLSETRAIEIYGDPLPDIVRERLDKELNSIIKNGFSVMYIIAQKLVHKSLSDGYLVGSRGSVGSSFVANMAGITEVNSLQPHYICNNCKYSEFILDGSVECGFDLPDKACPQCGENMKKDGYDIPFETFLGFDGDKEPDIDLNFSGEYQPRAHKYTEELFGEGHVFRAGTIATVAQKTAYGFVKNYLDDRGIIVSNAEINRLVSGCTGVKRTTGQHPGGIMIVPQDKEIFDFSPIQRPADATDSNVTTTHFDYHFLHGSILKLDILGHDDPTVIKMLEDLTGVKATDIPIGEKRTMGLFRSTESLGIKPEDVNSEVGTFAVPEFGTKFVRQMLVDTKPTTFGELIRISGLSHGTDVWLNNAQDLIRANTAELSQVICCRDDIMIYLIHAGLPAKTAFKIMEDVRKGKGLKEEYVEVMKENKVPSWYIDSCNKIKYMFPKAHAAAYVMMAFRIAWFKVYYPEAFYVAYFTVRADDFDAEMMTYGQGMVQSKIEEFEKKGNNLTQKEKNVLTILEVVNEMYARGIKFLPVDLYKSDASEFQITSEGIRPPLNALQGLGTNAAQNIVEARKAGEFLSKDELRLRGKASKTVIEILQQHGCLDNLPDSNQMTLF